WRKSGTMRQSIRCGASLCVRITQIGHSDQAQGARRPYRTEEIAFHGRPILRRGSSDSRRKEIQMSLSKQQHLDRRRPPKRILSLDGGGIRGILTLEYLSAIENMLKKRSGSDDCLLCDYFDLIGGTSTGSIIAAGLACGMSVARLKQLFRELGKGVFV